MKYLQIESNISLLLLFDLQNSSNKRNVSKKELNTKKPATPWYKPILKIIRFRLKYLRNKTLPSDQKNLKSEDIL